MFPFQWRIKGYDNKTFSEQICLNNIDYGIGSNWERMSVPTTESDSDVLYNERNYFYEFVHDALYDNGEDKTLIRHFERKEPKHDDVTYIIDCGNHIYNLKVAYINLNLYSTGVGVLAFFLYNDKYPEPEHIFRINQSGRRLFPPFLACVQFRDIGIIAHSIEIKGLHGRESGYKEDFNSYTNKTPSNQPATFITDMIHEIAKNIDLKPVIDDRMFVQCWYKNDDWAKRFYDNSEDFRNSSHWYEFVFVDDLNAMSCQNTDMQKIIIEEATYERWQKKKSLYGISRYSMVLLTETQCPDFLLTNFETMYSRMAEVILIQNASVLRFSSEVTNLSNRDERSGFSENVSSLYKEYIRFVNQIHFREISAQDQGIEMYQRLYETMNLKEHVEKLDDEIGELYNYVVLREDHKSNNTMSLLTWIATIAVPITVVTGFFGMNNSILGQENKVDHWLNDICIQSTIILIFIIIILMVVKKLQNRRSK